MVLQRKSRRTIKVYLGCAQRFMAYLHSPAAANATREARVVAFLTLLADKHHVAASTQKQALCAIVYLYKRAICVDLGDISAFTRASRPKRLPEVFSREEATRALDQLTGVGWLWGALMYGCARPTPPWSISTRSNKRATSPVPLTPWGCWPRTVKNSFTLSY
jgi:hypothetical protein